jgi:hypothetical protein
MIARLSHTTPATSAESLIWKFYRKGIGRGSASPLRHAIETSSSSLRTMKKTNFDRYLEEQPQDATFAARFERAGEAWVVALQIAESRVPYRTKRRSAKRK